MPEKATVARVCAQCDRTFFARPSSIRHSGARFCSRPCLYVWQRRLTLADVFWSKVVTTDDCWWWTGAKKGNGYGHITRRGQGMLAHRVSYELHHGPIPDGMYVCHRCDHPACVNPAHLFAAPPMTNVADMRRKGRAVYVNGQRKANAKMTDALVVEMRARFAAGGISQRELGRQYGIAAPIARAIVRRERWVHVPG
jgi:hypothetical protein